MRGLHLLLFFLFAYATTASAQPWKTMEDSAKANAERKNAQQAVQFYSLAVKALPKDSANSHTALRFAQTSGITLQGISQYKNAEAYIAEARRIAAILFGQQSAQYASLADNLAINFYRQTQLDSAILYALESLAIREKIFGPESIEYSQSCNILGSMYSVKAVFTEAEKYLSIALKTRERVAKETNTDASMALYAQSCNNLAEVYRELGQLDKAERLSIEAKDIRKKVLKHPNQFYAISCNNLANIYRDLGQFKKAEKLYQESKDIREKLTGKKHAEYAATCNVLADLYSYTNEFDKAEKLYKEAKDIREELFTKESADYAQSCNNLANLYISTRQYDKAESLAIEAKEIWTKTQGEDDPVQAYSLTNLGQIYRALKQYDKAEKYFLQARPIWNTTHGTEDDDYVSNSLDLGRLYWQMETFDKADTFFSSAFTTQRMKTDKIFRFTNEEEKQLYLDNINGSSDEYYSFYTNGPFNNKAGNAYQLSLFTRNLILSSSQQMKQSIYASGDSSLNEQYNTWIGMKQQLAHFYSKANSSPEQIDRLETSAANLEKELARHSQLFDSSAHRFTEWTLVRDALKPGEAAIEFVQFNFSENTKETDSTILIAMILRKEWPQPQLVRLCDKQSLDTLLKKTSTQNINALYRLRATGNLNTRASSRLYDLVWRPIESSLTGVKKIFFAPSGNLFKISFAALRADDDRAVGDAFELVQLNTTATIPTIKTTAIDSTDKMYLYGGIVYDVDAKIIRKAVADYKRSQVTSRAMPKDLKRGMGFQFLPGSEAEVAGISNYATTAHVSTTTYTGINASEESFKSLNGKTSPSIIHVATHGFLFPDPKLVKRSESLIRSNAFRESNNPLFRSGLLFAGANNTWQGKPVAGIDDGILTAYEISNMYLPNTQLVVLSACETALGEIHGSEGVYGLQRAFKIAGVEHLVMSLWQVPDVETAEFMQLFYKNILSHEPINESFYHAQETMKKKYRAEPFKWAAWILVQ